MKIILREDIEKLGTAGDLVTVKDGYARNFLIPRALAYLATEGNLHVWEHEKKKRIARIQKEKSEAEQYRDILEKIELTIPMQVGEEGRLFGSVTNRMLGDAFAGKGQTIDHRHIEIDEPIRSLGDFTVKVRLAHGVHADITVHVLSTTGESAPIPAPAPVEPAPEPPAEATEEASA